MNKTEQRTTPEDWMKKAKKFIRRRGFTCPQGNTLGGLKPVNFINQKQRPGDLVVCKCIHCGCITRIGWRFIEDYLSDED